MAVRPGEIDIFDEVDELASLATIRSPVSLAEAAALVRIARRVLDFPKDDIGLQRLEVHEGPRLVAVITNECRESTRALLQGWGINCDVA